MSDQNTLSGEDWKKWAINAVLWLDIPVGFYFGQIMTMWILKGHAYFSFEVFTPNLATISSLATWFGGQIKGLRDRYKQGT